MEANVGWVWEGVSRPAYSSGVSGKKIVESFSKSSDGGHIGIHAGKRQASRLTDPRYITRSASIRGMFSLKVDTSTLVHPGSTPLDPL